MEVKQIYSILNTVTTEVLGSSVLVQEDLSNIVDVGAAVFNSSSYDKYTGALVDKVGKVVFVNRPYAGFAPSLYMDGTTWGNVIQKIGSEIPEAVENESYELTDGASYDPFVFHKPVVYEKFFAKYVTFEVQRSITRKQLESAFNGVSEMDMFLSMIFNEIEKSFTVKLDALVMRCIDNAIGETMYAEYNSGTVFNTASHVKAVNLLYLYNTAYGLTGDDALTAAKALHTSEFIRFAAYTIGQYSDYLKGMSTLFNIGGKQRFTPKEDQHIIFLSAFAKAADTYLQSDTFHNEFTKLPTAEIVPYWQGSGTGYALADISKVYVTTSGNHAVTATGVLGVMFDTYAMGVTNIDRWVNTQFNGSADFTNYFYKYKAGYFNDVNENFIVFFMA